MKFSNLLLRSVQPDSRTRALGECWFQGMSVENAGLGCPLIPLEKMSVGSTKPRVDGQGSLSVHVCVTPLCQQHDGSVSVCRMQWLPLVFLVRLFGRAAHSLCLIGIQVTDPRTVFFPLFSEDRLKG